MNYLIFDEPEVYDMKCRKCNVSMVTGTTYQKIGKKYISEKFIKCPRCYVMYTAKDNNNQNQTI